MGSGLRRWAPIVLVVASVVLTVLATEVAYRVMRRFVCVGRPTKTNLWRSDDRYGWDHKPHAEGMLWGCIGRRFEWRVSTKINAHGRRDTEHAYAKPSGVRRVLLLGDSMTEAVQVPLGESFAFRLERELDQPARPVEVINAGVAAFGTDNAFDFFRAEGVRYEPDVVVLVFNVVNDVIENSPVLHARMYAATPGLLRPKTYYRLDDAGSLIPVPPRPWSGVLPTTWWSHIEKRLYLVRALGRLGREPATPVAVPASAFLIYETTKTERDPVWEESWAVTMALIRELREEVERHGARFAVAILPFREAVMPGGWQGLLRLYPPLANAPNDPEYPARRLRTFLAHEGIPALDLLPPLRRAAERTGASGFFVVDGHFDETGHARAAEILMPFVDGLLSPPAAGPAS